MQFFDEFQELWARACPDKGAAIQARGFNQLYSPGAELVAHENTGIKGLQLTRKWFHLFSKRLMTASCHKKQPD